MTAASTQVRQLACNPAAGLALLNAHQYLGASPNPSGVTAFDVLRQLAALPLSEGSTRDILQLVAFDAERGPAAVELLAALEEVERSADISRALGATVQLRVFDADGVVELGGWVEAKLAAILARKEGGQ